MSDNKDDISKILADFKEQKEMKENNPDEPLAPPVRRNEQIDFAKTDEPEDADENALKAAQLAQKKEDKLKKKAENKEKRKARFLKVKKVVLNKKVLISLAALILAAGVVLAAVYAVNASKTAYLKPYQNKYPGVTFPVGISEKYCDMYGENPNMMGYLEIPELSFKAEVSSKESGTYPLGEKSEEGSDTSNYVVYLNDNSLEALYKNAAAYNKADGLICYSDLYNDYTFRAIGAFYTNTKAEDDDGYIFPYNVTEKMTPESAAEFTSKLESRFLYSDGSTFTRQEKLLTISCATDYHKDFRFVVVAVLSDEKTEKPTVSDKKFVNYPQVVFDQKKQENPYRFASKWYPEIIVKDSDGNESTVKQTMDDYK